MLRHTRSLVMAISLIGLTGTLAEGLVLAAFKVPDPRREPAKIEIKSLSPDDALREIKSHKDKIVVVDTWATWCPPCVAEFPHLVELHQKYGDKGVLCVSVSVDDEEKQDKALKFLQEHKAAFPNYRVDMEPWGDKMNIKSIPIVFVFQNGKMVKRFDKDDPNNQFTYKQVEAFVKELLVKKGKETS